MPKKDYKVDTDGLKSLYKSDPCARALFDYFANRTNNSTQSIVDRLKQKARQKYADSSRREVVSVLKQLEKLGCGKFVVGRHGRQSRFAWSAELVAVGKAAKGISNFVAALSAENAQLDDEEEEYENVELAETEVEHKYNLRPNCTVSLRLPSDLSTKEATRLADFIKTLPFNEEAKD